MHVHIYLIRSLYCITVHKYICLNFISAEIFFRPLCNFLFKIMSFFVSGFFSRFLCFWLGQTNISILFDIVYSMLKFII